jgi:hypothetical protein
MLKISPRCVEDDVLVPESILKQLELDLKWAVMLGPGLSHKKKHSTVSISRSLISDLTFFGRLRRKARLSIYSLIYWVRAEIND